MRRGAIGCKDVELIDDPLADIAVQVVACGNRAIWADDGTGGRNPVALGVVHAVDLDRAMHGEIEPVDRQGRTESLEKLCLECVVDPSRYGTAGYGACVQ
ncbi:hypothetical protein D9M72_593960 [compost metagenome]